MAGHDGTLIGGRTITRQQEVVHETQAGVQQRWISRRAVPGDPTLQQMADAIKLVAAGLGLGEHAFALLASTK